MKKAVWVIDYDFQEDKCYKHPGCRSCDAPVFKYEDNKYHCVSCGEEFELSDDMIKWFEERKGSKIEMEDCTFGCKGKKCVEVHYHKNPVTLKWQCSGGHCTKCGMRFMV